MSLSSIQLNHLKSLSQKRKIYFTFWEENPDRILTAILLGNTLINIFCGVLAASIGTDISQAFNLSGSWMISIVVFIVGVVLLFVGEIIPKILGRLHADFFAAYIIFPLIPLSKIIQPIIYVLVRVSGVFVKLLGAEKQKDIPSLTAMELKGMLDSGNLPENTTPTHGLIKNILEFGHLSVQDVCKPREKIVAVNILNTPKDVLKQISISPFSRIPVYRDSLDNIEGIIYAKDLLTAWRTEGLFLIPDLLRPVYFVSEKMLISDLLREFKKGKYHFAIVLDQAKKVKGMITIEDILEELVGKIYDEVKLQNS